MFLISQSVCAWQAFPTYSGISLWVKPGTYPRVEHLKGGSLVYAANLLTNNRLGWKDLPRTNTLAYYENS